MGTVVPIGLALKPKPVKLRILHCFRAPVGGLFRHVRDLAQEQAARGHDVGVICDATASDPLTEARLAELVTSLSLGLHKVAMSREVGVSDLGAARATRSIAVTSEADIIHGHGAKGGTYARIAAWRLRQGGRPTLGFYTPHGGSLHYDPASLKGRAFMAAERFLLSRTDGLIFESRYAADTFAAKVAQPTCPVRIVHNGVLETELRRVEPAPGATDFLFVGELRLLKGVDVLIAAMATLAAQSSARLTIVGAGPDEARFRADVAARGLDERIRFAGAMPAREAFRLGRVLVLPSRAESLPYVALEAAGAALPLIATSVGGIPEIVAGTDTELVPPDDAAALARAMRTAMSVPILAADRAGRLQRVIGERFTVDAMTDGVLAFYRDAASRTPAAAAPRH